MPNRVANQSGVRLGPMLAAALGVYLSATLVAALFGLRMRIPFEYYQFLDAELLRDRFWESIWNLHSQPPLMNVILGAALKLERLTGIGPSSTLFALHFVMGGVAVATLAYLAHRMIDSPLVARVAWIVIALHPVLYLTVFDFFYSLHETTYLALIALFLVRFHRSARLRDYLALCLFVVALTGTRSLFHYLWGTAAMIGALALAPAETRERFRPHLKRLLACLGLFVLLLLAWPAKNYLQFGFFSYSSWRGFNLSKELADENLLPGRDGLYDEEELAGENIRWTDSSAEFGIRSRPGRLRFRYRIEHPDVSSERPVTVSIAAGDGASAEAEHLSQGIFEQTLAPTGAAPDVIRIQVFVSRAWTSPEGRDLGAGLYEPEWIGEGEPVIAEPGPLEDLLHDIPPALRRVPVLTKMVKSDGSPNWNHYGIIEDSRRREAMARKVIAEDPAKLVRKVALFYWSYTRFTGRHSYGGYYDVVAPDFSPLLSRWLRAYELLLYQDARTALSLRAPARGEPIHIFWPTSGFFFLFPVLIVLAAREIARLWRTDPPRARLAAFMLFSVVWVFILVILGDGNEANRIRTSTEPFLIILFFLTARSIATRRKARKDANEIRPT